MQASSSGHFPKEPQYIVSGELRQACLEALKELLEKRHFGSMVSSGLTVFVTGPRRETF